MRGGHSYGFVTDRVTDLFENPSYAVYSYGTVTSTDARPQQGLFITLDRE